MEIALFLAGVLIAAALAGESLMGALCLFAAFQFVATIVWVSAGSVLR
jgi:hypothetical protein